METYVGTILLFAFNFTPSEFLPCDGSLHQISQYQALFALIGPTYGGDGRTTFALPKLAAPLAGTHYAIAVNGLFPSRP